MKATLHDLIRLGRQSRFGASYSVSRNGTPGASEAKASMRFGGPTQGFFKPQPLAHVKVVRRPLPKRRSTRDSS